jgi:hypothetical protein
MLARLADMFEVKYTTEPINTRDLKIKCLGFYMHSTRTVHVPYGLADRNLSVLASTILHEIAHALDHRHGLWPAYLGRWPDHANATEMALRYLRRSAQILEAEWAAERWAADMIERLCPRLTFSWTLDDQEVIDELVNANLRWRKRLARNAERNWGTEGRRRFMELTRRAEQVTRTSLFREEAMEAAQSGYWLAAASKISRS